MENDEGVFHKMSNFVLEAKKRDLLKKEASKKYRKEGFIPANMYGQGENVNFLIKKDAFEKYHELQLLILNSKIKHTRL